MPFTTTAGWTRPAICSLTAIGLYAADAHDHADHAAHGADAAGDTPDTPVLHEHHEHHAATADIWHHQLNDDLAVRLIDLSAVLQLAVGGSNAHDDHDLEWSQSGAHDPDGDGFTFQQLELGISGALDPLLRIEARMVVIEDGIELEEAYAVTTDLPHGLELEAGLMHTEFGIHNPLHPHEFTHIDQPLVLGALLGPEGLAELGLRARWQHQDVLPIRIDVSVQNADGERAEPFLGEGHDHDGEEEADHDESTRNIDQIEDLLWSTRLVSSFGDDELNAAIGASLAMGPNKHDDHTLLWGADLQLQGTLGNHGHWLWISEVIAADDGDGGEAWGLVTTAAYDPTEAWRLGLRIDYVARETHEAEADGNDHAPAEVWRIAPMIVWRQWAEGMFRLQYNLSDPDEGDTIHSVWLGMELRLGKRHQHAH